MSFDPCPVCAELKPSNQKYCSKRCHDSASKLKRPAIRAKLRIIAIICLGKKSPAYFNQVSTIISQLLEQAEHGENFQLDVTVATKLKLREDVAELLRKYGLLDRVSITVSNTGIQQDLKMMAIATYHRDYTHALFVDADDYVAPDFVQKLADTLAGSPPDVAAAVPRVMSFGDGPMREIFMSAEHDNWDWRCPHGSCGLFSMVSLGSIRHTVAPVDCIADEWSMWKRLKRQGYKVVQADTCYYWRRHEDSVTSMAKKRPMIELVDRYESWLHFLIVDVGCTTSTIASSLADVMKLACRLSHHSKQDFVFGVRIVCDYELATSIHSLIRGWLAEEWPLQTKYLTHIEVTGTSRYGTTNLAEYRKLISSCTADNNIAIFDDLDDEDLDQLMGLICSHNLSQKHYVLSPEFSFLAFRKSYRNQALGCTFEKENRITPTLRMNDLPRVYPDDDPNLGMAVIVPEIVLGGITTTLMGLLSQDLMVPMNLIITSPRPIYDSVLLEAVSNRFVNVMYLNNMTTGQLMGTFAVGYDHLEDMLQDGIDGVDVVLIMNPYGHETIERVLDNYDGYVITKATGADAETEAKYRSYQHITDGVILPCDAAEATIVAPGYEEATKMVIPNPTETNSTKIALYYGNPKAKRKLEVEEARSHRKRIFQATDDEKLALYWGRLANDKNILGLIDAARYLSDWKLVLMGYPTVVTDVNLALRRLPDSARSRVLVLPPSEEPLSSLASYFDCMINVSPYEGFCNSIAESMACGLPVVSTRVGLLLSNFAVDAFYPIDTEEKLASPEEIAAALISFSKESPEFVSALARKQQEVFDKYLSLEVVVESWKDFLREINSTLHPRKQEQHELS